MALASPSARRLCGPGSGPEPSRQRQTEAGRKAAGSLPRAWECGAGQAPHQLWGPCSIISAGWEYAQRLPWADTPSLETVDPLLLLPLAPHSTPQFRAQSAGCWGQRLSYPTRHISLSPLFPEVALARGTPVFRHRTRLCLSLLCPLRPPFLLGLLHFSLSPAGPDCPVEAPDWLLDPRFAPSCSGHLPRHAKVPSSSENRKPTAGTPSPLSSAPPLALWPFPYSPSLTLAPSFVL